MIRRRLPLGSLWRRSCSRSQEAIWAAEGGIGASDTESGDLDLLKSPAKKTTPPLLFPWRHGTELPRRLVERKKSHQHAFTSYEATTVGITTLTGGFYFSVPIFQLLGQQWRVDLAESASWAFVQGLAAILSNTYDVPVDTIATYKKDGDISIDFNYNQSRESSEGEVSEGEAATATADREAEGEQDEQSEEGQVDDLLMESSLCNLFRDAHKSGKDQIQVCLDCHPVSAELHSLHTVPAISRNLAETRPDLLRIIQEDRSNDSQKLGNRYLDIVLRETGKVESTIFAEVFVYCNEIFWVRDLQSGVVVQGQDDSVAHPVVHAIRLERLATFVPKKGRTLGDWMITDIDDLLDGNQWFTPTVKNWWHAG